VRVILFRQGARFAGVFRAATRSTIAAQSCGIDSRGGVQKRREAAAQLLHFVGCIFDRTAKVDDGRWALVLLSAHSMEQVQVREVLLDLGGEGGRMDRIDEGEACVDERRIGSDLLLLIGLTNLQFAPLESEVHFDDGIEITGALSDQRSQDARANLLDVHLGLDIGVEKLLNEIGFESRALVRNDVRRSGVEIDVNKRCD